MSTERAVSRGRPHHARRPVPDGKPAAHIVTFGCQMNEADSEKMAGILLAEGYRLVGRPEEADLVVLNTCSIRAKAEQKVFSLVGRLKELKRKHPGLVLAMAGCIAQKRGEDLLKGDSGLDLVVGTARMARLPELLAEVKGERKPLIDVDDAWAGDHPAAPLRRSGIKAWMNIMFGCDNHCAYCVVPGVRGRERSRPFDEILDEAVDLARRGYLEATLLGQNVNSYGRGLERAADFAELLRELDGRSGLRRLRFTTSHPKDFTSELIGVVRDLPTVCEAVHLPLQAGADGVLRRMNRGYLFEDYRRTYGALKEAVPEAAVTTDIIVGFPGESQADFDRTLRALEELRFDGIFSFCFSPREGTAAWSMADDVPAKEKTRRLMEVQALQKRITLEKNRELIGRKVEVLAEGPSPRNGERLTGRTRGNKIVHFEGPGKLAGTFVSVEIEDAGFVALSGRLAD